MRSGKTLCMALSFFSWSMARFDGENFAICGKTIGAVRRNLLIPVRRQLEQMGFLYKEKLSQNYLELSCEGRTNRYYLFSGRDAGSAALIQGMTLAGVLFDEVALQARGFVEQAVARCSVEGSKFWFNCNPEYPGALVLHRLDSKASGEKPGLPALSDGGQPLALPSDAQAI